jgi:ParB-like chromosome segregation protein Spo0J
MVSEIETLVEELSSLEIDERIEAINRLREAIHKISPFSSEPVDFIRWVKADQVEANDYNPNSVAPPEMKLLEHSILEDGYTQPIVAWQKENSIEVVDGFHRNRVGKESLPVMMRVHGYLPIAIVNNSRLDRGDRIAATIRHNRARGKHRIDAMSDIVVELKRRNWSNDRICRELGMDNDEVLRLCQITGLAELFADQEFSKSWDVEGSIEESDFEGLSDDASTYGEEINGFRSVNTSDPERIFHTYDQWECYKAGFYATTVEGMSRDEALEAYRDFLADTGKFSATLEHVITEWKHSCEHYLTNKAMNRIAWLGQAAACYALHIPSTFRGGFGLLTESQQKAANEVALTYLNRWLEANGKKTVTMEEAYSGDRQSDIY